MLAVVREHKVEYNNTLKLSALRRRSTEELDAEAVAAIEDPQDNPEAAIQLEHVWNELTRELPFLTVCPYPLDCFDGAADPELFSRICASHSAVSHAHLE